MTSCMAVLHKTRWLYFPGRI